MLDLTMKLRHFSRAQLPATPWRNGGGSTQQIACWPADAGLDDFGWRASLATIAADGPFSLFVGVDRHIMLLEGDGVRLRSSDGGVDHRLDAPHRTFAFSGDVPLDCSLLGGASIDFNVMTRRGLWRAEVQVLDRTTSIAAAAHGVLLALRGAWRMGADAHDLRADEGLCWREAPDAWQATPASADARLVAVRIVPA